MRRKDREITDIETIRQIIDSCETMELGLYDPDDPQFPYIVPVNFGYTISDSRGTKEIVFYIHGAREGRKFGLMQKNQKCSFTMYCNSYIELLPNTGDVTSRYRCIMGKAELELLEGEEAVRGLEQLMARRADTRCFDWNRKAVPRVCVWKLRVTAIFAKVNKPSGTSVS